MTESDIANYTDGTTLYDCQKNLLEFKESESTKLFHNVSQTFSNFRIMFTADDSLYIDVKGVPLSKATKLLGIIVENKLSSEMKYVKKVVKKIVLLVEFILFHFTEKTESHYGSICSKTLNNQLIDI